MPMDPGPRHAEGVARRRPLHREAWPISSSRFPQLVSDSGKSAELDLSRIRHQEDAIRRDVRIVVDFDYNPRPAPRPTAEIVTAMNRIMHP